MASTVEFPSPDLARKSSTSIVSRFSISQQPPRVTTLDLISLCYGSRDQFKLDVQTLPRAAWIESMESIYDPDAGK
jgi:hypothetical protein